MVNKDEILLKLYETSYLPHSFGGIDTLYKSARKELPSITRKEVKEFLEKQPSYTLHKLTLKRFPRRKILSPKPGVIASCDLADVSLLSRQNRGYKYILIFIDVFSRFAQAIPVKKKDGLTIANALKVILNSGYFDNLRRLNTDEGGEFYNNRVKNLLKSKGIILYSVSSREIKASLAERLIRTIKGKMYRYMSHNNTNKYIDILPHIIDSYNNSQHRGLGNQQTPAQVHHLSTPSEIRDQFHRMYKITQPDKNSTSSNLSLGQTVRLADEKRNWIFRKGYTIQNTFEIFKIRKIDHSQYPTVYLLEDLRGDPVKGIFYKEEIVPTELPEYYPIHVIRKKTIAGRKKYFVRWVGYPPTFNSWLDEEDLTRV